MGQTGRKAHDQQGKGHPAPAALLQASPHRRLWPCESQGTPKWRPKWRGLTCPGSLPRFLQVVAASGAAGAVTTLNNRCYVQTEGKGPCAARWKTPRGAGPQVLTGANRTATSSQHGSPCPRITTFNTLGAHKGPSRRLRGRAAEPGAYWPMLTACTHAYTDGGHRPWNHPAPSWLVTDPCGP